MELFTAGDQSQMTIIKRWIDESDVYMLILGTRYGTIEPESGKSYTHLEFDYALETGKPFFLLLMSDKANEAKIKEHGSAVLDKNQLGLTSFKQMLEKYLVKYCDDVKDIRIAISDKMHDYSFDDKLIGWIPGNEGVNGNEYAAEIIRLGKENTYLKNQLSTIQENKENEIKGSSNTGIELQDLLDILRRYTLKQNQVDPLLFKPVLKIASLLKEKPNLLHLFFVYGNVFKRLGWLALDLDTAFYQEIIYLGLIERKDGWSVSRLGKDLYLKTMLLRHKTHRFSEEIITNYVAAYLEELNPGIKAKG